MATQYSPSCHARGLRQIQAARRTTWKAIARCTSLVVLAHDVEMVRRQLGEVGRFIDDVNRIGCGKIGARFMQAAKREEFVEVYSAFKPHHLQR